MVVNFWGLQAVYKIIVKSNGLTSGVIVSILEYLRILRHKRHFDTGFPSSIRSFFLLF